MSSYFWPADCFLSLQFPLKRSESIIDVVAFQGLPVTPFPSLLALPRAAYPGGIFSLHSVESGDQMVGPFPKNKAHALNRVWLARPENYQSKENFPMESLLNQRRIIQKVISSRCRQFSLPKCQLWRKSNFIPILQLRRQKTRLIEKLSKEHRNSGIGGGVKHCGLRPLIRSYLAYPNS